MRHACKLWLLGACLLSLLGGCVRVDDQAGWIMQTAQVKIDENLPPAQARREAIQWAEVSARDKVLNQVAEMQVDGQPLRTLAIRNQPLQGLLRDIVRAAPTTARDVNMETGVVSVTVGVDPELIRSEVREFPGL